jgi:GNAT superfamily N-acetyltransferase
MDISVARFEPARREDFYRLHTPANGGGWCFCVAWWVPTWQGWGERSAAQNRLLRDSLCDAGEYDGYLLYVDAAPAGWCQAGPRDRLVKLVRQFDLPPDPHTWAITCFLIAAPYRRQGLSGHLLQAVLADLRSRGVPRLEAYPKRGPGLDESDLWNGPEALFLATGFKVLRDDSPRPLLALELGLKQT